MLRVSQHKAGLIRLLPCPIKPRDQRLMPQICNLLAVPSSGCSNHHVANRVMVPVRICAVTFNASPSEVDLSRMSEIFPSKSFTIRSCTFIVTREVPFSPSIMRSQCVLPLTRSPITGASYQNIISSGVSTSPVKSEYLAKSASARAVSPAL